MSVNFLRFTHPSWLFAASIPPGGSVMQPDGKPYAYINVTDGGMGFGGSAPVDVAKVGGPNAGTFFWSFGEDATSRDGNRGYRALALNTDYHDDLFHNSFAVPTYLEFLAVPGPTTSITILAGALPFVSEDPLTPLTDLFMVTDFSGNELFIPPATTVQVASITGASVGDGFPTGDITLNLNATIPGAGPWSSFRLHYRKHKYLSTAKPDPIGRRQVGAGEQVVQQLFRLNGNPAGSTWWNSSYVSDIWSLALSGLNERYNRGTAANTSGDLPLNSGLPPITHNTAGSGSWYRRFGPAMSGWTQRNFWGVLLSGTKVKYLDPLDAIWTAHLEDYRSELLSGSGRGHGGASAFVTYGSRRYNKAVTATNVPGDQPGLSKFMGLTQRRDSAVDTGSYTKITPGSSVTFDTTTTPGTVYVTLGGAGDHFHRSVGLNHVSSIAVGYDMLEIEHTDLNLNTSRRTYIVAGLDNSFPTRCSLVAIDGELPSVADTATGTLVRWLTLEFFVGDGIDEYRESLGLANGSLPRGFIYAQGPTPTSTAGNTVPRSYAAFYASGKQLTDNALAWGGFNSSVGAGSTYQAMSVLAGSGDILSLVGGIYMAFAEFTGNITSDTGSISAPQGLVSGLDVAADGPPGAFNGIVSGKQIAQKIQTIANSTNVVTFTARDGLTMYYATSYAGPGTAVGAQFNFVSTNTTIDSELKFILYRSNPATVLSFWLPLVYSDNGVTPIPTFIDPSDTVLTPATGPGGAVDVFIGRQVGNAIYWQAVGHYSVPLGATDGSHVPEDLLRLPTWSAFRCRADQLWRRVVSIERASTWRCRYWLHASQASQHLWTRNEQRRRVYLLRRSLLLSAELFARH